MSAHGDVDMGHTVAGWTGTSIGLAGSVTAGVGVILGAAGVIAGGLGAVAAAVITTWILHLAGWGKPGGPRPADQWDWRVRDLTARQGHAGCVGCRLGRRRPSVTTDSPAPAPSPVKVGVRI
ncbi:HGxxPAAW family protein [Streptomyces sp. NPDC005385]|uniref:HGxxPAAW family protein n=1 Tax=Streptomyces sp. NPDC005385 TaxID=3157039 RepID=UPI0033B6A53B